ncbi:helix-turn-helix transcriptional regulator [Streptosporangium sp. V21-05]|uniref:helix-turn-helix transcriptional regulator n=1 Tax=Streptosporangium sp. V21-05 TaxID=3446115 RepID=UPI003F53BB04
MTMSTERPGERRESGAAGRGGELFAAASQRLRQVMPFDAAAWFGTDPTTMLPISPLRVENIEPDHCEGYWRREYGTEDVLLFRDVARSPSGGGTLGLVTGGCPGRSPRYREFMEPQGYGDNLRAAFRIGERTWGVVDLFRDTGRRPFTERDVRQVTAMGPELALGLAELAIATTGDAPPIAAEAPGTALFDESGQIISLDAHAERWLGELTGPRWDRPQTPLPMATVQSVVARARSVAAGRDPGPAAARLRGGSGRWLVVHAACLRSPGGVPGPVAVVLEPANSAQIAPIIVEAYCLTPREQQITQCVARGLSTADIATDLHLSAHTVRHHLKAIFTKFGITSRGELVAKLFADHYGPLMHAPDADVEHVYI